MGGSTVDSTPHGDVQFYYDGIQQLHGLLPRTCRLGGHDLSVVGYTHAFVDRPGEHRLIVMRCPHCTRPDDTWVLVMVKAQRPYKVELDDGRYEHLRPRTTEPFAD
ncbi:hypothetical protein [Kutzneria sp. 744]|uniref:hypothetical protein n=1 Tax=Kutzneria sp. (strain 744) TaxID=345341 RepID=UPI0005B7F6E1|nr:hypothetical protein [Kutzneria sp. 744]